ncbi:protein translocase subunit SecDF [Compostibacter hankyongensis]|uniref:Multifunctional fusion protein n=1 Tax=Compostibacter hankyongensis TaxID=1007089 RepID=A0ABP8FX00_9BACT
MQLKGLVKFFTVVLILISLYQLSFTLVVHRHEKKVKEEAKAWVAQHYKSPEALYPNDKEQQAFYQNHLDSLLRVRTEAIEDSTSDEIVFNTLIKKYTYQQAKEQELSLGLDLQGGMNVVLEVSLEDLIRTMANNAKSPAFNKALALATERKANSAADYITLFGQAWSEVKPANEHLAPLFSNAFEKKINYNSSDATVLNVIREEARGAITRTYNVLQQRIDKFGVAQPNINLDVNKGIISVELAGVSNPERVRKYLQATAKLEFWETYQADQDFVSGVLNPMDAAAAQYLKAGGKPAAQQDTAAAAPAPADTAAAKATDTGSVGSLSQFVDQNKNQPASADTGGNALLQGEQDHPILSLLKAPQMGGAIASVLIRDTAKLNHYLSQAAVANVMPKTLRWLYGAENRSAQQQTNSVDLYAIKTVPGSIEPRLGGEHVVDARQDIDPNGRPEISMTMDNTGAKVWARMTGENVHKPIAIVLDNVVYSAPAPSEEISGGRSSITGSFTIEEAQDLANILKTGKLPAPAHIVQEQIIGPTLGQESIIAGAKSFIISFVIIFVLMLIYYNTSGWVANIALIFNLLFTVGILAALGATLTMPGIAGLVLTIGMAVDTNVIIFERIKEELVKGKSYQLAISDGYKHSYAPVLDAHITTLLTAGILYYFGLGPVKGFATTQILGILLSLFCGILISRIVEDWGTSKEKHFKYFTPLSKKIFQHASFKFIEKRKYAYMISALVLIFGVGSFIHGFDEGVEFSGGRSYTVRFDEPVKTEDIGKDLQPVFDEYPMVKTVDVANQVNITTSYLIHKTDHNTDSLVERRLYDGLKKYLPAGTDYQTFDTKYKMSSQTVLPTISDDLKKGAVKATIFALLAIFAYILIRFRKWQYSVGTIIALLHDVLVTLAVFSYFKDIVPFSLEINQHFIAAILTVIGYSMNDTVIVFDRIREYFRHRKPGEDRNTLINRAINDTLSRTIMTSLTVFLTILILFLVGGESTRGFAFAMLIGVITGTYSSIFIASPVLVDMDKKDRLASTLVKKGTAGAVPAAAKPEAGK